jgi:uncharacterized membrane protein
VEQAIQLFGYLILAVLGFVLPVITVLLSMYREGLSKLAAQYKAEKKTSEENIKEQLQKKGQQTDITDDDLLAIENSLKQLRSIKKTAESKLSYLDPKKQVLRLFIPLMLAFLGVVATNILVDINSYYNLFLIISVVGFTYAIVVLWKLIVIIIEVRKIIDTDRKDTDTRTTELLTALLEEIRKTGQYYLKKVYITVDGDDIVDNSHIITVRANNKTELKLGIDNRETRMVKNIEIGFIFPNDFIVEKSGSYSIYRDEKRQIIRYSINTIQGDTNLHITEPLIITPLEQGEHKIVTFVKAENIEATDRNITIKVIE